MFSNVFLPLHGPEWICHLGHQTLWEAEKIRGLFGSGGGKSQKTNSKEVFLAIWEIGWDGKRLGHSKMESGSMQLWPLLSSSGFKTHEGDNVLRTARGSRAGWGHYDSSPKDRIIEAQGGPPFASNWKSQEIRKTYSASPQLLWLVTDVCLCWASVYPSIKQESCPSHM